MRIAAALVLALIAAPALAGADDPAQVASGFYTAEIGLHEGGIPAPKGLARLSPFLSAGLQQMLADADKAELAYAENTHHAVPPLLEGDIFVSLFEGATSARVGSCEVTGDSAVCPVDLHYDEGGGAGAHWTDRVHLTRGANGWGVDDIAYGGNWDFGNKGTLKDALSFAIHNASGK